MSVADLIRRTLTEQFKPVHLDLVDDSASHAGHKGNTGGGHYSVLIVSGLFVDVDLVTRHRMVNEALKPLFKTDIHALALKTLDPTEWSG